MRECVNAERMRDLFLLSCGDKGFCKRFEFLFGTIDERSAFPYIDLRNFLSVAFGSVFNGVGDHQLISFRLAAKIEIVERGIVEPMAESKENGHVISIKIAVSDIQPFLVTGDSAVPICMSRGHILER